MTMDLKEYCRGVKGIIFDYGGTIDSHGDHWSEVIFKAWKAVLGEGVDRNLFRDAYVEGERAMARERVIMPEDDFRTTLYKKILVELDYYLEHADESEDEDRIYMVDDLEMLDSRVDILSAIEEDREGLASDIADECDAMARESIEEARPVLGALKEKYPLVLVSNFYGNVESVLRAYNLKDYFDSIVESAVVGVRKPDPAIFALGVEALGMAPEEVAVIGDTFRKDIEPALKTGCRAIWLKGKGWSEAEDAQEYPYTIKNLESLRECLL